MKKKIFTFLLTVCLLSGCNLFKKQNETNNNNQKEASMCDVMLYYGEDVEPNSSYGVAGDLFVKSSGAYYVKRGENIEYVNNLGQLVNGNYDGRWVHCGDFIAENQRGHERIDLPSLYMDAVPLTSDLGIAGDFYLYKDSLNFYYKGRSGWISRGKCEVLKNQTNNVVNDHTVKFWSSFGGVYTTVLNGVVEGITNETGIKIEHTSQGSYDKINSDMISAIAVGDYPNIAMGYPDHFATYLSSDILTPLDAYLSEADIADYYAEYMNENYFYDYGGANAQKKIYALPFNKSTELLGYNGVFVDYCATQNAELANIPLSWDEWEVQGPKYNEIFQSLMGKKVYGVQTTKGSASGFEVLGENDPAPAGKKLLLDMSKVDSNSSVLMTWDATDNAFITLTKQWGAEYTNLPESEKIKAPRRRIGEVLFNSSENQPKVIDMLKYFNRLNKAGIFGTPASLGGSYSSDAFAKCNVMFMICSSGGLSYNTAVWEHRFRVSPIPYKYADNKQVISQGANICLTDKGEYENSVKVIKALTTGKFQTEWCLQTGYYPCSKSALESAEYQAFLNEDKNLSATDAYAQPLRVAYREGSKLNSYYYMNQGDENGNKAYASSDLEWNKFVDPAFKGSSELRQVVKNVLAGVFSIENVDDTAAYAAKLNELENAPTLKGVSTIKFVH